MDDSLLSDLMAELDDFSARMEELNDKLNRVIRVQNDIIAHVAMPAPMDEQQSMMKTATELSQLQQSVNNYSSRIVESINKEAINSMAQSLGLDRLIIKGVKA